MLSPLRDGHHFFIQPTVLPDDYQRTFLTFQQTSDESALLRRMLTNVLDSLRHPSKSHVRSLSSDRCSHSLFSPTSHPLASFPFSSPCAVHRSPHLQVLGYWGYILAAEVGALIMTLTAVLVNNLPAIEGRKYPKGWLG